MSRVLLVSNDFPPRRGGIQSYLRELVDHLVADGTHTLTVYAPKWKGAEDFDRQAAYEVVRHPGTLMLPVPSVAGRMRRLIKRHDAAPAARGAKLFAHFLQTDHHTVIPRRPLPSTTPWKLLRSRARPALHPHPPLHRHRS